MESWKNSWNSCIQREPLEDVGNKILGKVISFSRLNSLNILVRILTEVSVTFINLLVLAKSIVRKCMNKDEYKYPPPTHNYIKRDISGCIKNNLVFIDFYF